MSDLIGWVPFDLSWRSESTCAQLDRIAWLYCGGVSFSEAFFLQTIDRVHSETQQDIIYAKPDVFSDRAGPSFDYRPAGLIFHTSRCGSTAVANGLKCCDNTQVVSEYWPLTQYLWRTLLDPVLETVSEARDLDTLAVKTAVWCLGRCRSGSDENVVLKLTSSSLHSLAEIKRIWPEVPCLAVIRDPLEIAQASLRGGGWMGLKQDAAKGAYLAGVIPGGPNSVAEVSDEEYAARVVGNYLAIIAENLSSFDAIVRHDNLSGSTIIDAASLFNLAAPVSSKVDKVLSLDAKSNGRMPYPQRRVSTASDGLVAEVNRYARGPYEEIISRLRLGKVIERRLHAHG
ncbi:hypothetical protein BQ8794_260027 [Mesorhizobium prunaredense]|uniref:Sulfotransferase family protein n=1 Tax=Mesorhizobium prunaredense TaxID=1631249 RepID=A0A1R3VBL9_9HYPH|nr:hypothetical protein [Mesorhizobium prunaredense]SIT56171.1 hypothetical protein BQ8794_260027 [Mesorhizobium prunaredense]